MRSLIILVATTVVVSGLREAAPGFAVDYRTFGGSPIYQELPYRDQPRSFRETVLPLPPGQSTGFRQETYREYRQPFAGREETRVFRDDSLRGGFKDDGREIFKDELRTFSDEARPFRDDARVLKDENRGFRDEARAFRDERVYRDEIRGIPEGPRNFRDERTFRNEQRPFRDELRHYRDGSFSRDEPRPFRDETRTFNGPRNYRDELGPFRNDVRPFRDESGVFRDEKTFREEPVPLRNEPRPFREDSRPFKDELLFTQESQTLAEAQHRFNKEHRQPLSFGGHSNYLKYGNHGLGFASIPSAILPLEDDSTRLSSGVMIPDMTTTSATQSPNFLKSGLQVTLSPVDSSNTKSHISATLAPEVGSTPSQSTSGNPINGHAVNQQRTNENLVDGGSTSSESTAVTISTSGGTSVTPKVLFTSGSASTSSSPMGINGVGNEGGAQQAHGYSVNSLHASKQGINVVATPSSYFPSVTSPDVPEALLNYVFKYQMPEDTKTSYTYRNSLQPDSFNQIQAVPMIHHQQTAKYSILPELKIPGLSTMRQSGGIMNYVSTAGLPKVPYLTANSPAIALGAGYSTENVPTVNFARNLIQLDRDNHFSHLGNSEQINGLHGQSNRYNQLRQLAPSEYLTQLGHYEDLGQAQQARNDPFNQGGLQLQLGGFGGIDYNGLSGNSEGSRVSPAVNLALAGTSQPAGSTFTKISFGEPLWQL